MNQGFLTLLLTGFLLIAFAAAKNFACIDLCATKPLSSLKHRIVNRGLQKWLKPVPSIGHRTTYMDVSVQTLTASVYVGTSTNLAAKRLSTVKSLKSLLVHLVVRPHTGLVPVLPTFSPFEDFPGGRFHDVKTSMIFLYLMWLHSTDSSFLQACYSSSWYKLKCALYLHWLRRTNHCTLRHLLKHSPTDGGFLPPGSTEVILIRLYRSTNLSLLRHPLTPKNSFPHFVRTVLSQGSSVTFGPEFSSDNSGDGPGEHENSYKSLWTNIPTYKQDDYISW